MTEAQMPNYPGLTDTAALLWRDFLGLYEDKFTAFQYNVTVGQGIRPARGLSEKDAATWKRLTQKRIDVVASRFDSTWIIEIDERPGARTFGQLQMYKHMFPFYHPVAGALVGALICRFIGFDMFGTFSSHDNLIFKFPYGKVPSLPPTFLPTEAGHAFNLIGPSTANP